MALLGESVRYTIAMPPTSAVSTRLWRRVQRKSLLSFDCGMPVAARTTAMLCGKLETARTPRRRKTKPPGPSPAHRRRTGQQRRRDQRRQHGLPCRQPPSADEEKQHRNRGRRHRRGSPQVPAHPEIVLLPHGSERRLSRERKYAECHLSLRESTFFRSRKATMRLPRDRLFCLAQVRANLPDNAGTASVISGRIGSLRIRGKTETLASLLG